MGFRVLFIVFFLVVSSSLIAQYENYEHIISYDVDIQVNTDRSINVVEKIKVRALGISIQRGIFREIPTSARDEHGQKLFYDLEINYVYKDGEEEPYHFSDISNGVQIRIGQEDVFLEQGDYEYTISYTMSNQVRFFESYDELYWNATGNFWRFEIKKATARITLPIGAQILQYSAYVGDYGETGTDYQTTLINNNQVEFITSKPLMSYEGLTIAVGWNKGVIPPPTEEELNEIAKRKYKGAIYGGFGLLLVFGYLFWAWIRVGVDPKKGVIIPRFSAPEGYSPAACRYIMKMGYDKKAFTTGLVSMAVKGYLNIDNREKNYKLHRIHEDDKLLTAGEKKIAKKLFRDDSSVEVDNKNHSTFSSAMYAQEIMLKQEFQKANFRRNGVWMVPAILMALVSCVVMLVFTSYDDELLFPILLGMVLLFFGIILVYVGVNSIINAKGWRKILPIIGTSIPVMIFIVTPMSILIGFDILNYTILATFLPYFGVYVCLLVLIILFFHLIKAPTVMGRKSMDQIEGLRLYLEVAEKERFNLLNAPEKTPELFEKLLPYAIALDVENEWGEQFEDIISKAIEEGTYQPSWYTGSDINSFSNTSSFSNSLGRSFTNSVSSASVSPQSSSSSGSSGGGFSGGGGGGGGGGGW